MTKSNGSKRRRGRPRFRRITKRTARAIQRAGYSELGRHFGLTRAAVYEWSRSGVPAERVQDLAPLIGMQPHEIRPDVFPAPEQEATQ